MLDNVLLPLIIDILKAGESAAGIPGTPIAQAFQPTQQGVNTEPSIYLHKLFDHRYGFLGRKDEWNQVNEDFDHVETQQYETTFQISTLATQNPETPAQYTASDICNLCAAILQSDTAIASFKAQGVGIERITAVRNPYFEADRGEFEASPSFDFVLTHKQIITTTTPQANPIEIQEYSI